MCTSSAHGYAVITIRGLMNRCSAEEEILERHGRRLLVETRELISCSTMNKEGLVPGIRAARCTLSTEYCRLDKGTRG